MLKRYGGVKNYKNLSEIEEAEIYTKPPVHLSKVQIVKILSLKTIKLIPTVILMGVIMWVISFTYLTLIA